jgi:GntR family transcriptional regulator
MADPRDEIMERWDAIMSATSLPRMSPLPLHARIGQFLVDLIESGRLSEGERLPPERYLAQSFGVSLAPVRQAILELVSKGLLVRSRGQGTFVKTPGLEEKISVLGSWTQSVRQQQAEVTTRVLRQERVPTPPYVARALNIHAGDSLLIERLAVLGREPVALLASYLSARTFPGLVDVSLAGQSLYELLEKRYGTVVSWAESVLDVARCSSAEAERMDMSVGDPLLRHEGTAFTEPKRPVEYFRVLYRADRVRFHIESRRQTDGVVRLLSSGDESDHRALEGDSRHDPA